MDELKMTQEEFEILDRILSGRLHKRERLEVIALIDKEGFSRRPEPLVRGMEIDVNTLANEIRIFDGNNDKGAGAIAEHLKANAHVWLKEKDTK